MSSSQFPNTDKTASFQDSLAHGAGRAADGAGRVAHPSIDALAGSVAQVRDNAAPALHELAVGAEHLARNGANVIRDRALKLRDSSAGYVRGHPLQTVLIAAGVGAALALLVRALTHRSGPAH